MDPPSSYLFLWQEKLWDSRDPLLGFVARTRQRVGGRRLKDLWAPQEIGEVGQGRAAMDVLLQN